jgi:serine protease AprX
VRTWKMYVFTLLLAAVLGLPAWAGVDVSFDGANYHVALNGGAAFHDTASRISGQRTVAVPDSPAVLVLWNESTPAGDVPFYAISLDGQDVDRVRQANYDIMLRAARFDPGKAVPAVAADLGTGGNVFIVQFVTQALPEFSAQIEQLGGKVYQFVTNYAYIVYMDPATHAAVQALPYVRWVGSYDPGYRIEEVLRDNRADLKELFPWQRYNIMVFESGMNQKHAVAERIKAIGGLVNQVDSGKFLLQATLSPDQLWRVITWDEVHFVDRWGPYGKDMDKAREYGGADYIESVAGYDGYGVRGEVFDAGFNTGHGDFASRPLIEHGSCGSDCHGASTSGIVFGDGTGDPTARGLLPAGQGIIGDYQTIGLTGPTRYQHTGEETQDPYYCVFETSSVGSPQVNNYTTDSADTDAALFDFDIVHCQSQSNTGSTLSRPQAWAKNIVSGGAAYHYDTLDPADDCWCGGASTGPATDGRIKPDLCGYYDKIHTTTCGGSTAYTDDFGGTSGATPIIAGHFGLFFQMWADGIFGNEVDPAGTVFDNRPHMTTAKAVMINNAHQYPLTSDLSRVHQGWGWPNVQNVYDRREKMFIIDETELLQELQTVSYALNVDVDEPEFKATLVYADPPGSPAAAEARINDLTLRVTDPSGQVYWGNNGLMNNNYSTPGGTANHVDTVENVFVQNPASGLWVVEVIAEEINEDSHVESPEVDADFALVVSGVTPCSSAGSVRLGRSMYACESTAEVRVLDCDLNMDPDTVETITVVVTSDSEPAGEPVELTETGPGTAAFRGSLPLSATDAPGVLWVADGNIVTVTYIDADDGQGHYDVERTATSTVDCLAPEIFDVQASDIQPRAAHVSFEANEPVSAIVFYGESCGFLDQQASLGTLSYTPSVALTQLQDDTTYYFAVQATDAAGNFVYDDNGGECYSFTTPEVPDYFTEVFSGGNPNDLANLSLLFEPNGSNDFYFGCVDNISELPTDPEGGTALSISEDQYVQVTITGGHTVGLYGTEYSSFWVSDNGYITFGAGDGAYTESPEAHFNLPRISALFDDFSVDDGGDVSYKQLDDRIVVTYLHVPEYSTTDSNTFQVEMYFDGRITISYLQLDATDGLAGLSQGLGLSPDFLPTDLSAMGACYPLNISLPNGAPELIPPDEPTTIGVRIRSGHETYVPDSGMLYYSFDGSAYQTAPLAHVSGELFEATLPPPSCGDIPAFYFSATGSGGSTVYYPLEGEAHPLRASVGTIVTLLDDNFESDLGWTVWNDPSLTTGAWERAIPLPSGTTGAPLADYDGSGRCCVTDNRAGEADVDGGPTILTSPAFDASGAADLVLKYARWFACDDGLPPAMDYLNSEVSNDDGANWVRMQHLGPFSGWVYDTLHVADFVPLTSHMRIRFSVMDEPNNSITEAGIDAVLINYVTCGTGGYSVGDLNCDGSVNGYDIDPFVLALTDPAAYAQTYADCDYMLADCNGDGSVNGYDIDPFVLLLTGG